MSQIHIGTSGWQYKEWNKTFYPKGLKGKQQLPYLAEYFDTVEVNSSFYRLPRGSAAEGWRDTTPGNFRFAVKLNNYITHSKKLILDDKSRQRLKIFARATEPLGDKLAAVLVQLPPSFRANLPRLEEFAAELPKFFKLKPDFAYEFRHDSWFTPELYQLLKQRQGSLVIATWPGKFKPPYEITSDVIYIRYHASPEKPDYAESELKKWADWLKQINAKRIYIYFNNDYEGWAITNAEQLKSALD